MVNAPGNENIATETRKISLSSIIPKSLIMILALN